MKLFLISQTVNGGYDTFDSAVVVASDEENARNILPEAWATPQNAWAAPKYVAVKYLGEAAEGISGVVCASFNAG